MANPLIVCVGVDGTPQSQFALEQALHLLEGRGGEIHAVSVVQHEEDHLSDVAQVSREIDEAMEALRAIAKPLLGVNSESPYARLHVRVGHPATAIHQVAVDYDADLIVVGSNGRPDVEKWRLGVVAEELVAIARCPVLVSKERDFSELPRSTRIRSMPAETPSLHRSQVISQSIRLIDRTAHISGLL